MVLQGCRTAVAAGVGVLLVLVVVVVVAVAGSKGNKRHRSCCSHRSSPPPRPPSSAPLPYARPAVRYTVLFALKKGCLPLTESE